MPFPTKKPQPKEKVEALQETHLSGPADQPFAEVSAEMYKVEPVPAQVDQFEKIIFHNQRDPGHALEFHAHSKENPFKMYTLVDGKEYVLPKEVIRNLENCRENIEKYRRNADGNPEIYVAGYKSHFVCERA